jgi:hypothetical protein
MESAANINAHSATRISMDVGGGSGTREIRRNSTLTVKMHILQQNGSAMRVEFQYPEWSQSSFSTIYANFSAEGYDGEKALPPCTAAAGSVYTFPISNFQAKFTE